MKSRFIAFLIATFAVPAIASSQQPVDVKDSNQIKQLTPTDPHWKFTTELVETLPASATVPTPLKVLGYVPGTIGKLSHVAELNKYFHALADASPRTKFYSLGKSDEGREMIALVIADEETIKNVDRYRANLARLADPRGLSAADRARLVKESKPIYWLSGSIHSPETGSPEMLMELAYRLAVDESDFVKDIRNNEITIITPVSEVDGRDRMVDADKEARDLKLGPGGVPLIYWGKYTAHDNNRDAIVLSQKLTQNIMSGFLYWKPVVLHDLHESVPFLYTSTGTGPYNDEYDPIVIDEWHTLAYQEITELTRRGLPGVWTHGFYDGWAPNYTLLSVANLHNSIGRFYETYTSRGADCHTVRLPATSTSRTWDRPNPPVNGIKWCIRSNLNYQQSGALIALKYVADHKETFLENYVAKAERMIERGRISAPYAFVIPRNQRHSAEAASLVNLFRAHGAEVQTATSDFRITNGAKDTTTTAVRSGDWIVRLDQPYAAPVRTLLAIQKFKADDPPPYDDTGWTLDELRHVLTLKVADSTILTRPMQLVTADVSVKGNVAASGTLLVKHIGDWRSAALPWTVSGAKVSVAEKSFKDGSVEYPAGTYIVENAPATARDAIASLGLDAASAGSAVTVARHGISLPRIALMHSWLETQNEGWVRFAFDQMGIPYTYISDQQISKPGFLDKFDAIFYEHVSGPVTALVNGRPMIGPAIPWKKTAAYPNLGMWDETDDIRRGMGFDGVSALKKFLDRGGLLITTGNSSNLPISMGLTTAVAVNTTTQLNARGGIYRAQPVSMASPILYGYENKSFPIYFNQSPVMQVTPRDTTADNAGIDPAIVAAREGQRAKVILKYHQTADSLLVSGLLAGGQELAGKAAVVDAPVGKGHVILFGIRPLWRWESQGSFAMAINAIANWNHLQF
jgi:hypothetical protein